MEAIWIAAGSSFATLGLAVVGIWRFVVEARELRKNKLLDWERQDEVARAVQEASEAQAKAFKESAVVTSQIHVLVNSTMTEAIEAKLRLAEGNLVLMQELVSVRESMNVAPSPETMASIEAKRAEIATIKAQLADRAEQTKQAESLTKEGTTP